MCNLPDGCSQADIDRRFQEQNTVLARKAQRAEKLKKSLEDCLYEARQVFGGQVSDTVAFLTDSIDEVKGEMARLDQGLCRLEDEWRGSRALHLEAAE
ncbi:hypothetical protein [Komagataeibacter xylinus]|uniref:Uncharacterized protein n=1 Tax=Komagataeibacter xylinus TaxID=28448 RepID=A0A857FLI6_KOMXY|nr:hypothetical protein [Komagataeibacter xylinus]QHC34130.1 hypothetical protein FMA36_00120 [Komagataeibacter xylinus]